MTQRGIRSGSKIKKIVIQGYHVTFFSAKIEIVKVTGHARITIAKFLKFDASFED